MHRGRIVERLIPIFPRYIFVACDGAWSLVRDIIGVLDFVRTSSEFHTIAPVDAVVERLLDLADAEDTLPIPEKPLISRFQSGERVLITGASMLAGQHAVFVRLLAEHEAVVDIDGMGRMLPVPVDDRDLEPARVVTKRRRRRRNSFRRVATMLDQPAYG